MLGLEVDVEGPEGRDTAIGLFISVIPSGGRGGGWIECVIPWFDLGLILAQGSRFRGVRGLGEEKSVERVIQGCVF